MLPQATIGRIDQLRADLFCRLPGRFLAAKAKLAALREAEGRDRRRGVQPTDPKDHELAQRALGREVHLDTPDQGQAGTHRRQNHHQNQGFIDAERQVVED